MVKELLRMRGGNETRSVHTEGRAYHNHNYGEKKQQQQKNGYFLEKILGQNIVERTMEAEIDIKSKKTKDDGWANSVDSLQTI